MIRTNNFYVLIMLVIGFGFSACEETADDITSYTGENFFRFATGSSAIAKDSPTTAKINVLYSNPDGGSGTVEFEVMGGTEGVDYNIVNGSNTLTIDKNTNYTGVIEIQPLENPANPGDQVLTISLKNATNGVISFPGPDNTGTASHSLALLAPQIPIGGDYTAVSRGTSTDVCCPDEITNFMAEVTITDNGDGTYTMNDFSGGLYLEWYDIYGITSQDQSPATFNYDPIALTISFVPGSSEPFGTAVEGTGSYDPVTGILTYHWVNGYDDEGDVVLTPK